MGERANQRCVENGRQEEWVESQHAPVPQQMDRGGDLGPDLVVASDPYLGHQEEVQNPAGRESHPFNGEQEKKVPRDASSGPGPKEDDRERPA